MSATSSSLFDTVVTSPSSLLHARIVRAVVTTITDSGTILFIRFFFITYGVLAINIKFESLENYFVKFLNSVFY